jgi:hypothetical protein
MFDFPASPAISDTVTGLDGVVYEWDGVKWTAINGVLAVMPDAPSNGTTYGRMNAAWTPAMPLTGGTLTGPLILAGNATNQLGAVTLQQLTSTEGNYLPLTGGTLTGGLAINVSSGWANLSLTAPSGYGRQIIGYTGANLRWTLIMGDAAAESGGNVGTNFSINRYNDAGTYIDTPLSINRASGLTTTDALNVNGGIFATGSILAMNDSGFGLASDGSYKWLSWQANWVDYWRRSDGLRLWNSPSGTVMSLDGGGNLWIGGGFVAVGAVTAGYIHSTGNMQVDGSINATGNIITPGNTVQGAYIHSTGSLQVDTSGNFNGRLRTADAIMSASGTFYVADNTNYYLSRNSSNGNWYFAENGFVTFRIDTSGNIWPTAACTATYLHTYGTCQVDGTLAVSGDSIQHNVYVDGNLGLNFRGVFNSGYWYAFGWDGSFLNFAINGGGQGQLATVSWCNGSFKNINAYTPNQNVDWGSSPTFYNLYYGSSGERYFATNQGSGVIWQFQGGWYWDWNWGNGNLGWPSSNLFFFFRITDGWSYNARGPVGGVGGYQDVSDIRTKTSISDAQVGLNEVLRLRAKRFRRLPPRPQQLPNGEWAKHSDRFHLGFTAQDVREVIPEAVSEAGIELADGTGGLDTDAPTLAITLTPIVAALVNGMKELAARVATLEGR